MTEAWLTHKKTLMLDIDGVLNSHASFTALGNGTRILDPVAVRLVEMLILEAKPVVVWSTSWRGSDFYSKDFDGQWNVRIMQTIKATPLVNVELWWQLLRRPYATPRHIGGTRGKEILEWMTRYERDPSRLVVLDDRSDIDPYSARQVKTDYLHGFGINEFVGACELFGIRVPQRYEEAGRPVLTEAMED